MRLTPRPLRPPLDCGSDASSFRFLPAKRPLRRRTPRRRADTSPDRGSRRRNREVMSSDMETPLHIRDTPSWSLRIHPRFPFLFSHIRKHPGYFSSPRSSSEATRTNIRASGVDFGAASAAAKQATPTFEKSPFTFKKSALTSKKSAFTPKKSPSRTCNRRRSEAPIADTQELAADIREIAAALKKSLPHPCERRVRP